MRPVLVALGLAMACLSGCFDYGTNAVFAPRADTDMAAGAGYAGPAWALSVKAKPAQGPAPLAVTFSVEVRGAPSGVPWSVDFGDGSGPAHGKGLAAAVQHVYAKEGKHHAFVTIGDGANATTSTLALSVLPPGAAVEGPQEEVVAEPVAPPPSPGPADPEPAPQGANPSDPSSSSGSGTTRSSTTTASGTSTSGTGAPPSAKPAKGDKTDPTPSNSTSSSTGPGPTSEPSSTSPSPGENATPTDSPSPSPTGPPTPTEPPLPTESPSPTGSPSPIPSESPTPTEGPPPPDGMPEASLVADPASAPAPATVTYTVNATDPDGDELSWQFMVDGVELGNGTGFDLPQQFVQTYDAAGNHTAVFTVTDGLNTVWWEVLVTITEAEPAS